MSAVEDILNEIPLSQLASELGVDEQTAEQAVREAVPTLIGGIQNNAGTDDGATSLAGALEHHATSDLYGGGFTLGEVDTNDGEKIVGHVFGDQADQVAATLGARSETGDQTLFQKLLPILAPIVLAYLARKVAGGKYGDVLGPILAGGAVGGAGSVLLDVLTQVLGGSKTEKAQKATKPAASEDAPPKGFDTDSGEPPAESKSAGDVIGDILGSILGKNK